MNEVTILVLGTVGAAGVGSLAYHFRRMWNAPDRVDDIVENVAYVRTRVDQLYDHLVGIRPDKG